MATDLTRDFVSEEPVERTFTVLDPGDYPFTIAEMYEFEVSKANNNMMRAELEFHHDGETVKCTEFLTFTEGAKWKINQFLKALEVPLGTRINWRDAEFIKYLKARKGVASLGVEDYIKKDKTGGKRNVITGYIYEGTSKREAAPVAKHSPVPPKEEYVEEDDIPF
jgi:hypothetical protein